MAKNLLGGESSPYLLQHADNPVEWYPWGPRALDLARSAGKPIFLSIGYSACHWCHVMAHESFENGDIADVMNQNFVNIKVDREERPDIDAIYQSACQMATGQGGWPLSVFLTPDQKPFYIGTYFPVMDAYGRPGFGSILRRLAQAWRESPADIKKSADTFLQRMKSAARPPGHPTLDISVLDEAAVNLFNMGDATYGGFGTAPKFPNVANLSFMFRYGSLSKISRFHGFALKSLRRMARGGIFDQIGGGFHRYSTDRMWLVPHFEKMLYDNALIPVAYAEAYQITKDEFYLDVMRKTLDFVLAEMTSPSGGFYSALDADSEGEEGRFYVWTRREIEEALGDDAKLFCLYYDVTDGGNWEGKCILCSNMQLSAAASACSIPEDDAKASILKSSKILLDARNKRVRPGLDDKILASWNAMMISALARGYRVSGNPAYLDAAKKAARFIMSQMTDGGALYRAFKGEGRIRGFLEDYSCMICALLDLFEEHPEAEYLEEARRLGKYVLEHFWDGEGGFYMTADNQEPLVIRPQNNYDLATPSGSSVAIMALIRLHHMTSEPKFLEVAKNSLGLRLQEAADNPFAYGYLLNVAYLYLRGPSEITVMGAGDGPVRKMVSERFLPTGMPVFVEDEKQAKRLEKYPFFAGKPFRGGTRVYVCRNMSCTPPLDKVPDIQSELERI